MQGVIDEGVEVGRIVGIVLGAIGLSNDKTFALLEGGNDEGGEVAPEEVSDLEVNVIRGTVSAI